MRPKGNLPVDITSLVGRRHESYEVKRLLGTARLVTLTGVGGVGKTRVALRAAGDLVRHYADGVWLVSLADLDRAELIAETVAGALGVQDQTSRSQVDVLGEFLGDKQLLLVLDTCERLASACADLAERLLGAAPGLRIMATSREPLHAAGEHVFVVPPLVVANSNGAVTPSDATELFAVRAAAASPGFLLTAANLPAVAELCRRLDGIPLAIELAAVRLRVLSVEQIAERLNERFRLLTADRATVVRHQTMRTAVDWSYELCEPAERLLWARLAVFTSPFDLASVEAVCADDRLPSRDVADRLAALLEKSIVHRTPRADDEIPLFEMLDTIRDYAAERLRDLDEEAVLLRRHRDYHLTLVRRAEQDWSGHDQLPWFRRLTRVHGNLRAALDFSLRDPGGAAIAAEMAARLWFFWIACGFLREGRHYLEQALATSEPDGPQHLRAQWACAFVAATQGDIDVAEPLARRCASVAQRTADRQLSAYAAETLGQIMAIREDLDAAVTSLDAAIAHYRAFEQFDPGLPRALSTMGITRIIRSEYDAALLLARECGALCDVRGEQWVRSYANYITGLALRAKGNPDAAAAHVCAAIEVKHRFRDIVGLVMCVELLAGIATDTDDGARAAQLLGAAHELWQSFGLPSFGSRFLSAEHERCEKRARQLVGDGAFEEGFRLGAAFNLDELVGYAIGHRPPRQRTARPAPPPVAAPSQPDRSHQLTTRELEVARLVAQGLSNREIAERLVIAKRTADSHIEHILNKLGFNTRMQIAAWVASLR